MYAWFTVSSLRLHNKSQRVARKLKPTLSPLLILIKIKGVPSPVQIFIYHVTNRDNFSAENPLLLVSSADTKASRDYRRIAEVILQPGQQKR